MSLLFLTGAFLSKIAGCYLTPHQLPFFRLKRMEFEELIVPLQTNLNENEHDRIDRRTFGTIRFHKDRQRT